MYKVELMKWRIQRLFWPDRYIHETHEGVTMTGAERRNSQNLCFQVLQKCTPWLCFFLDFFVKNFPNNLSFHYKNTYLYIQIKKLYGLSSWELLKDAASRQNQSLKAVQTIYIKEKVNTCMILLRSSKHFCWQFLHLLRPLYFVVFLFCLHILCSKPFRNN